VEVFSFSNGRSGYGSALLMIRTNDERKESDPLVAAKAEEASNRLRKGTLHYTRYGLVVLFSILLLGDFVLTMMETVISRILPLQLKDLGASNTLMAVLAVTMGYAFNLVINPTVSFRSDNLRTAWGRRIPYLMVVTPFVTLFLILLAFAPEIGHTVYGSALGHWLKASPNMVIIGTVAVVLVLFQVFNYCLQPVYYYLFVDVVPTAYMARFMALFRVVAGLQLYIFSTFIYGHALTHTRAIYITFALAYFVGFTIICLCVKEGEYPPPVHKKLGLEQSVRTYFQECFSHPHYIYFNLKNAFGILGNAVGLYGVFFCRDELKFSLDYIGKVGGWGTLIAMGLFYPMGVICDRLNAVRVVFVLTMVVGLIPLCSYYFMTRETFVFLTLLGTAIVSLLAVSDMPLGALILPSDRYGQLCSANQIVISVMLIGGSFVAGKFMDYMTADGTIIANYRYMFLWSAGFQALAAIFMALGYFSWKKYGGLKNYVPPEPWNDNGKLKDSGKLSGLENVQGMGELPDSQPAVVAVE
jgi:MFS family permease